MFITGVSLGARTEQGVQAVQGRKVCGRQENVYVPWHGRCKRSRARYASVSSSEHGGPLTPQEKGAVGRKGVSGAAGESEVDTDWLSLMLASEPWQVIDDDALLFSDLQLAIWRDYELPGINRLRSYSGLVFLGSVGSALALLVALRVIQTTLSLFLFGLILGSLSFF